MKKTRLETLIYVNVLAIERANRRKAELRRTIERIARECVAENFAERLKEAGMVLCRHKEEWAVTVSVDDGKERTYTFAQLGVYGIWESTQAKRCYRRLSYL